MSIEIISHCGFALYAWSVIVCDGIPQPSMFDNKEMNNFATLPQTKKKKRIL